MMAEALKTFALVSDPVAWVLANAVKVVGTMVLVGIPALYLWWTRAVRANVRKRLTIVRADGEAAAKKREYTGEILEMLDVDRSMLRLPPFNQQPLVSLPDYLASLVLNGDVNMEAAVITAAEHIGLHAVLPLAMFLPKSWRHKDDIRKTFSSSYLGSILAADMLSIQTLVAGGNMLHSSHLRKAKWMTKKVEVVGTTDGEEWDTATAVLATTPDEELPAESGLGDKAQGEHKGSVKGSNKEEDEALATTPLFMMWNGWNQVTREMATRLPNPFVIARDLDAVLAVGPDAATEPEVAPAPVPVSPFFPDLHTGSGVLRMSDPSRACLINELMSLVLNRLSLNALPDKVDCWKPPEEFVVQLEDGGEQLRGWDQLMEALTNKGHKVSCRVCSNITTFGCALCVKCDSSTTAPDGWLYIPLAVPMDTGLVAPDDGGGTSTVMTYMPHAGIKLEVSGPIISCRLEWCLSIVGITGWCTDSGILRPFQIGDEVLTWHTEGALDGNASKLKRALRLMTASSVIGNVTGSQCNLLFGGYGLLGVCCDSVAAIQKVMTGSTTLYPLALGGRGRIMLLAQAKELAEVPGWSYREEALQLAIAVNRLPCDNMVEPEDVISTVQRVKACLPPVCVFSSFPRIKARLDAAVEYCKQVLP